jgi:hypothetical protein
MKKLLFLFACVAVLCACGGSSSQSEEKSKPAEESKTLPASSLILKGKHAKLFKLSGSDYKVNLVKAADDWQVRVKMTIATNTPFNKIKDYTKYEREISGPYAKLLNSSDVELENLDMNGSDWDTLLQEDEEAEVTVSGKTYEYKHMSYEAAKELFDNTVAVEISGLELEQAKTPSATQSILGDDEDLQDLKDATESAAKLLEAEKELMKALF